jgi:hypothetical protein
MAETERFELSMRLYTPYSLSRGAPSAARSRFLNFGPMTIISRLGGGVRRKLVEVECLVQCAHGQFHVLLVNHHGCLDLAG